MIDRTLPCNDPDVALMLRVREDEPGAFGDLVREFQPRVLAVLYRNLGGRHEADDLCQDVFLRLYRARKRYEPRARVSTWIFHIAQNVARNAVRSRRRHAWLRYACLNQTEARFPERFAAGDGGDVLERREAAQQVRVALDGLMERQRRALVLQHYQNRSYPEIASALSLTPKAAKCLLYRARHELRRILAGPPAVISAGSPRGCGNNGG